MKRKRKFTKVLAFLLGLVMLVDIVPMTAVAAETRAGANQVFNSSQLSVATDKSSTLAEGVTENRYTVYNKNGEQVKMYTATIDMSVDSVKLFTSYKDMDNTTLDMSKLTEQVAAFDKKSDGGDEYYQGTVVAGINASYYNMSNGKPTGVFVMNGNDVTTEAEGNSYGYFAVMKDGTVKIGNKGDYSEDKGKIQEAIGIHTMLIVDGEVCSGLDDVVKYPRQTIGITADKKVVIMSADGQQAPVSVGLTLLEQAQVMADLGCVWAGHLDGGGSMTYGSRPEGEDAFKIINNPSDGSERSISNGLIVVSTAVSDGKFDHAVLTAENDYVTPGSTVEISAVGVDKAGGSAVLPENYTYSATNGTVIDGKFVSDGTEGDATVSMMVDGKEVGTCTIHLVWPTNIKFSQSEIVVPFGKKIDLKIDATYGVSPVAVKTSDFELKLSDAGIGTLDGFSFIAAGEETTVTSAVITATLRNSTLSASSSITLGKGSEVLYDFEDGSVGNWRLIPWSSSPDVTTEIENVTKENGMVHSGNNAMKLEVDYSKVVSYGYAMAALKFPEDIVLENATRIGMWVYLPDEFTSLWARYSLYKDELDPNNMKLHRLNGGTFDSSRYDTTATGFVNQIDEAGWYYFSFDISSNPKTYIWKDAYTIELYTSDRDGSEFGYYYVKNNKQVNTSAYGKFTLFIDDVTVDYSSAVDDREAPIFGNVNVLGAGEGVTTIKRLTHSTETQVIPQFDENTLTISAAVAENTIYSNASGLNINSAECYVDGYEVACKYTNGNIMLENHYFPNGIHTIKFAISDNMGNSSSVVRKIKVNGSADNPTLVVVPNDPTADRILTGSLYYVDLKTTSLADIQSVSIIADINGVSKWELDGIEVTNGFDVTYEDVGFEDSVKINFVRNTDKVSDADILASIPVRAWYHPENVNPAEHWNLQEFSPSDLRIELDSGKMILNDGTEVTFTSDRIRVDTEVYGTYAIINANGDYENRKGYGWHTHKVSDLADKEPTCDEKGYKNRTKCEGCNSVIDWGEIIPALGHDYKFVDGILKCDCGETFSGIYNDGKTYLDGVVITDGWNGDSYYVDGVKLTGLQKIDGYYYDFGTNGICDGKAKLDGFYYDESIQAYRYFTAGIIATGEVTVYPEVYFFDKDGVAVSGQVDILGYNCTFNEKGAFVSSEDSSVVDAGYSGTNIEYVLLNTGLLKVDGQGEMKDYTANGKYPAWVVQNDAKTITALEVGNGITKIGRFGFYRNTYLREITFEDNSALKTISWGAFGHNWRLTGNVEIPASVETIEGYAFYECGELRSITFETNSNLKQIGACAFYHDFKLESVFIPDSVISMGADIFARTNDTVCLKVAEYSVGHLYAQQYGIKTELRQGTIQAVQSGKLSDNISWELYSDGELKISGNGVMPNFASQKEQPWYTSNHMIKKITIGKDITSIGNYAFCYAQKVTQVEFEEGSKLKSIGVLAFFNAPSLETIVLPETVNSISTYAFADCFALKDVYIPQGVGYIYKTAFSNSSNVVLNVSEGTYAHDFAKNNGIQFQTREFVYEPLASGALSENVNWAMYENGELWITGNGAMPDFASHKEQPWYTTNHKIKKIIIGKDITSIGNYAFCYAQKVTQVKFEEGSQLQSIGVLSFFNTPSLETIVLPETVNSISTYAFADCFALKDVYIPQGVGYIYKTAFSNSSNVVLNVSEGTYAHDFAKNNGIQFQTREFVYEPLASGTLSENVNWAMYENGELWITGNGAMPDFASHKEQPWYTTNHKIKKIIIGKDITSIGNYAFCYAQKVTQVEFEEGSQLQSIGVLSFFNTPSLEAIALPETAKSITAYAFGDCFALKDVYIPQGVEYIHTTAFSNSGDVVLNVSEGTYAHDFAKNNAIQFQTREFVYEPLASGELSENVNWAMYENGELWITGNGAMLDFASHKEQPWYTTNHKIKKIVIGKDITSIGNYAFCYAQKVTQVEFEEGSQLQSIGVLSFFNTPSLEKVVLPETVNFISTYAFADCFALNDVYIPEKVGYIHKTAFSNSSSVVLNVSGGTYAEAFASEQGISYTVR